MKGHYYKKVLNFSDSTEFLVGEPCQLNSMIVSKIGWLPLVSLTIYVAAMAIGLGPLPWVVNAELFPNEAKDKGTSINTM